MIYRTLGDYVRREREDSIVLVLPKRHVERFKEMLLLRGYKKIGKGYVRDGEMKLPGYAGRGVLNYSCHVRIERRGRGFEVLAHVDRRRGLRYGGWRTDPFRDELKKLTDALEEELKIMLGVCLTGKKLEEVLRR